MTIHVTIDEAERRLAELVAAAVRGEDVVLDEAGGGQVRLVPVERVPHEQPAKTDPDIAARRRAAIGMWRDAFAGYDTSVAALKRDDVDPEERVRRKFGPPA